METPASSRPIAFRIHEGLERIAAAMRSDDWQSSRAAGINPAQFAILSLLEGRPAGLSVREVAASVRVSQPSATDSIAALERKGLVEKRANPADLRAVHILCTPAGLELVRTAQSEPGTAERAADALEPDLQEQMLLGLIAMIRQMQNSGAIPIQRMCVSCRYFSPFAHADAANPHHCNFVDAAFGQKDLRIDCREHETADPSLRAATWSAFSKGRSHPPGQ